MFDGLPEPVARYFSQGARDGITAGEAVAAWDRLRFLPSVLRDVTRVDTATTLLGTPLSAPVAVAPTTLQRAAHPDGEQAMARGVVRSGSLLVVSSNAGTPFAAIGATGVAWWLQLYLTADRSMSAPVLEAAVAAGARAVVLTADTPVAGTKYDDGPMVWDSVDPSYLRANFPPEATGPGAEKATDLGPHDVEWLAREGGLPVVVKGVLRADDARRSVDAGAAAIWVSNHGGRQLDRTAATARCLRPVAEAVGDRVEVYVDGGVRCGAHVLAALALGARGVFVGRSALAALADAGDAGVAGLLASMREELTEAMTLAGRASLAQLGPDLLAE